MCITAVWPFLASEPPKLATLSFAFSHGRLCAGIDAVAAAGSRQRRAVATTSVAAALPASAVASAAASPAQPDKAEDSHLEVVDEEAEPA